MVDRLAVGPQLFAADYLKGMQAVMEKLPLAEVDTLIAILADAYERGRRIYVVGNGGSAASASHLACDLSKNVIGSTTDFQIKRFAVLALTDNVPAITAWANDTGYDQIFSQQLRGLAEPGDLLVVITGSGNSGNIVEAVRAAKQIGLTTLGLLGFDGGAVKPLLDHALIVRSDNYGYIEDAHMMIVHLVTAYFREAIRAGAMSLAA